MKFGGGNFDVRKRLTLPKLRLGVPRVMSFDPFWQQAFAATLAPPRQSRPATFAFHTGAESVLTLARAFGWLISAFHIRRQVSGRLK
jgi:hypothetical protein